jgi:hypothetical protein
MQTVTRNIVGPGSKLYEASFIQADNMSEVNDVISQMGLTVADVNEALRRAKKVYYLTALDSTVDSKIEAAKQALITAGFSADEAQGIAESKRASLDKGLPAGLKDLNRVSKRGRKSDAEKAAEAAKQ